MGRIMRTLTGKMNSFGMGESKRRSRLGFGVAVWGTELGILETTPSVEKKEKIFDFPSEKLGTQTLSRRESYKLQHNAKAFLAMRKPSEELISGYDKRREWNKERRVISTNLDLFPSLKYSHSSFLPSTVVERMPDWVNILCSDSDKPKARMEAVARSHSIWIDPVDCNNELYKYRLRIIDVLAWSYLNDCVPIMMTLTVYHRWHNLKELLRVIIDSRSSLFDGRPGRTFKRKIGLEGYLNRLEITLNDGEEGYSNNGWHPHFHVVLIVPRNKLKTLSDSEQELRERWVSFVCRHFKKVFGEEIPESYLPAFKEHGLFFSRYCKGEFKGQLRPVQDSNYLAKIMGYDPAEVFGGDKELSTATLKDSKIPFDLLRKFTANNVDLWNEYVFATKGVVAFRFSQGLEKRVQDYFAQHSEKKPARKNCPKEKIVAVLQESVYHLFYQNFKIPQLLQQAALGYDVLCQWVKDTFVELGVSELLDNPLAMPRPPD